MFPTVIAGNVMETAMIIKTERIYEAPRNLIEKLENGTYKSIADKTKVDLDVV